MEKTTLKQIATVSVAGKLSIALGSAQAQDCSTFINLNLDSTPTFVTSKDGSSSITPSEVTIYIQAKEYGETALLSLTGIPNNQSNNIALLYSENIKDAEPTLGCLGSFVLDGGENVSIFRTGISEASIGNNSALIDKLVTAIGVLPTDGTGVRMPTTQVDVAFNFTDALGADKPSPDSFYLQALLLPGDAPLDDPSVFLVSNVVHVTINRTDSPPAASSGKLGTTEPEPEPEVEPEAPASGKT
jgi:hypothetical protein